MSKLNKLNISSFARIAASVLPFYGQVIAKNARWEQRQCAWEAKWKNSEDWSEFYRKLADKAMAYGFYDLSNVQPWFLILTKGTLPLKRVAELLVGHSLPDINPKKCFEFAKETPISAENWFRGCTDREDK